MNYLAHLLLAGPGDASRVGNLLGDFVKGTPDSLTPDYPADVIAGILMHRHLDRFTDDHPSFARAREFLAPERRRFAGIVIDIYYDHFLTLHWSDFSDQPLSDFIAEIYLTLERRQEWLSPELARILPRMRQEDWLHNNGTLDGLALTFARISQRSPRIAPVRESIDDFRKHYESFHHTFREFFPAAQEYASRLLDEAGI